MDIRLIEDKCDRCLRCVRECPTSVWREVNGMPVPVKPEICILCSHCLAVCPHGAIEHEGLDANQLRHPDKELVDDRVYNEIVRTRRSIRHYKKKQVDQEVIDKIIDLARYSPSASNSENVEYIIVTEEDLLKEVSGRVFSWMVRVRKFFDWGPGKMAKALMSGIKRTRAIVMYMDAVDHFIDQTREGRDYILHNAPVLLLLHGPSRGDNARDNCVIAATNIVNYAHSMGLGTCFVGFVTTALGLDRKLRKQLKVPKGNKVYASIVMGYPAVSHSFTVSRKEPKIRRF